MTTAAHDKPLVCIVDDDEAVRESLRILLFASGFDSCAFESADAWLACASKPEPDVFLLDLRMPGTDGTELHQRMIEEGSEVPVIFITGHGDIPLAVAAIQRGAADFLTKPFEEGELVERINSAVGIYRAGRRQHEALNEIRARFASLTAREYDVMELLVQGESNKGAAQRLSISPRTVEIHRARIMEKTGSDSIAELVRLYTQIQDPAPD